MTTTNGQPQTQKAPEVDRWVEYVVPVDQGAVRGISAQVALHAMRAEDLTSVTVTIHETNKS